MNMVNSIRILKIINNLLSSQQTTTKLTKAVFFMKMPYILILEIKDQLIV